MWIRVNVRPMARNSKLNTECALHVRRDTQYLGFCITAHRCRITVFMYSSDICSTKLESQKTSWLQTIERNTLDELHKERPNLQLFSFLMIHQLTARGIFALLDLIASHLFFCCFSVFCFVLFCFWISTFYACTHPHGLESSSIGNEGTASSWEQDLRGFLLQWAYLSALHVQTMPPMCLCLAFLM